MLKLCLITWCSGLLLFAQQGKNSETVQRFLKPSEDSVPKEIRDNRGVLYNRAYSIFEQRAGSLQPVTGITLEIFEEMPIAKSDAVIVGEVVGSQPFKSQNSNGLYTEYYVKALDKVKTVDKKADQDVFVVLRYGGIVRLDDGRIVKDEVQGDGDPIEIGKKYLFFLSYRANADAYFPLTIWKILDNNLIKATFPHDKARVALKESLFDGVLIDRVINILKGGSGR